MIDHVYIWFLCIIVAVCVPRSDKQGKILCTELPGAILEETLGSALNARYMSIDLPSSEMTENKMRNGNDLEFYVDNQYNGNFDEQPPWSVTHHAEETRSGSGNTRHRRTMDYLQWTCKSWAKWTDLGPDYFPRYMRSVECLTENCWFNMFKCRPKSFTVKILKRKRDKCVPVERGSKIGISGLPRDLRELWVWEQRAISFSCDCAP